MARLRISPENFTGELESIKKNQMEILKLLSEIENIINRFNRRLDTAGKKGY